MKLMQWLAAGLVILAFTGTISADAAPIDIAAEPVALEAGAPDRQAVGQLEFLAGFELSAQSSDWGGLSGMALSSDGKTLIAVADLGHWYRIPLLHGADGRLTGIGTAESGRLLDEQGQPVKGKASGDAEGLAVKSDGSFYVSFEHWHRLWRYRAAGNPFLAAATYTRPPKGLADLPRNEGIEAAAFLPQDRMLLLSEGGRADNGDLAGWLFDGKRWVELSLVPTGNFQPTDLTLLPDGNLLLLERSFTLLDGPGARLSIIPAASIKAGARLVGREIAVLRPPLPVDNFEAIAARKGPAGATLIYLLSDDNQSALQRTLLLQFRLR